MRNKKRHSANNSAWESTSPPANYMKYSSTHRSWWIEHNLHPPQKWRAINRGARDVDNFARGANMTKTKLNTHPLILSHLLALRGFFIVLLCYGCHDLLLIFLLAFGTLIIICWVCVFVSFVILVLGFGCAYFLFRVLASPLQKLWRGARSGTGKLELSSRYFSTNTYYFLHTPLSTTTTRTERTTQQQQQKRKNSSAVVYSLPLKDTSI